MIPNDRKYSREHEWVLVEDGVATIGLTDYAQRMLGDIVYVELPAVGDVLEAGSQLAVVESVKAASEVFCVPTGEVLEVNAALEDAPEAINGDPWGAWIAKIKVDALDEGMLLNHTEYNALVIAEEDKA